MKKIVISWKEIPLKSTQKIIIFTLELMPKSVNRCRALARSFKFERISTDFTGRLLHFVFFYLKFMTFVFVVERVGYWCTFRNKNTNRTSWKCEEILAGMLDTFDCYQSCNRNKFTLARCTSVRLKKVEAMSLESKYLILYWNMFSSSRK